MNSTPSVTRQPSPAQAVPGMLPASAYSLEQIERLATVCYKSGLFDDTTDAAIALVKILKGAEMGLPAITSMQAFDVIRKRLFIKPWAIAGLINGSGYGSYRIVEQTAEVCTIHFARKYPGQGWLECPPVSYTIQEARAAGLVERSPHWKASPGHMLYMRCMGRGGAMHFPELIAGLHLPQDDAPISPERHAQNVYDLFGVELEPGMLQAEPSYPETPTDSDQSGKRGGASITAAIGALHQAHGKDEVWLQGWWSRVCKERGVQSPDELALSTLAELHQHIRRYYANQAGQAQPEPDAEPALDVLPRVHSRDSQNRGSTS